MLRRVGLAVEGGRGPIGVAQAGISAVGISANVECDERRRTNVSRLAGAEAMMSKVVPCVRYPMSAGRSTLVLIGPSENAKNSIPPRRNIRQVFPDFE